MATKSDTTKKAPGKRGRPPKSVLNDKPDIDQLSELYHQMVLIRRFEEKAGQLYGMGQIGGFCHLYI
ncbi:MAG: pyruvate dehydrogenase (acetyl-transferring) E1 component subunit alpha, partial [Alphaproteobacteria bacterium]